MIKIYILGLVILVVTLPIWCNKDHRISGLVCAVLWPIVLGLVVLSLVRAILRGDI